MGNKYVIKQFCAIYQINAPNGKSEFKNCKNTNKDAIYACDYSVIIFQHQEYFSKYRTSYTVFCHWPTYSKLCFAIIMTA